LINGLRDGMRISINDAGVVIARENEGREASPRASVIDAQAVRTTESGDGHSPWGDAVVHRANVIQRKWISRFLRPEITLEKGALRDGAQGTDVARERRRDK
jgi:hypothetical protein